MFKPSLVSLRVASLPVTLDAYLSLNRRFLISPSMIVTLSGEFRSGLAAKNGRG